MKTDHQQTNFQSTALNPFSRRQLTKMSLAAAATGLTSNAVWSASSTAPWPLWSVEGLGGKAYVLGGTPARAQAWHDARIAELLASCATLWTETNRLVRGNMRELVAQHGLDPAHPLSQRLSATESARLAAAARVASMTVDELAPYRPWLAALTLENAYHAKLGHDEAGSAEKVLITLSQKMGISMQSEFPVQDDVMTYMGGLTKEADEQYLSYTLDQILADPMSNERMYAEWSRGESEKAEAVVLGMKTKYPAMYDNMVLGRNRNWIPRFEIMLKASKPSLVVVGFFHMAGPDSLLAQLRSQGWTVRAV